MAEPWSTEATERLLKLGPYEIETKYYGACISILTDCFPIRQGFSICPVLHPMFEDESIDLFIEFILKSKDKGPLMIFQVMPTACINNISTRMEADDRARESLASMSGRVSLPHMYLISAMGPRCSIYKHDRATDETMPEVITEITENVTPMRWWNTDLSTLGGRQSLAAIFDEVKQMSLDRSS